MAKELAGLDKEKLKAYWKFNIRLTTIVMVIWFVVTYVAGYFSRELNELVLFGFPFGFYMGAQGSLVVYVVIIFYYAYRMNKLDQEYDVAEKEG